MAQTIIKHKKTGLYFPEDLGNGIKLDMVLIKGGTFTMGAPKTEEGSRDNERPQHQVTVPTFFMGKYQVTQAQWKAVAALPQIEKELKRSPSRFKGDNLPVERVSWYDAVEFCARLSNHTGRQFRLPSEAEWEYACRAGTITPFHFGKTITTDLANYRPHQDKKDDSEEIYRRKTTSVGSFGVANAFGLYDMHGNLWEWCLDDSHGNYKGAPTDGSAWLKENDNRSHKRENFVLRGGSWDFNPGYCRSASRYYDVWADRDFNFVIGFRVVCVVGRALK